MSSSWVLVALLAAGLAAAACDTRPTPTEAPTGTPISPRSSWLSQRSFEPAPGACIEGEPRSLGGSDWFEGTCYGWRVGAEDVLGGDPFDRRLQVDCEPQLYGDTLETSGPPAIDHQTDLDIEFADLPSGATVEHIDKWACGSIGLSDHLILSLDGADGTVDITRSLEGNPWLPVPAFPGSVRSCDVVGKPAVCIERNVEGSGRLNEFAYVFVIEDATLDPHAVVLRLYSDVLPLSELLAIARSVVSA